MRLLFAANTPADPHMGGAPAADLATIEALRRRGHEVDEIWEPARPRRIAHANLHQLLELPRAYRRAIRERHRSHAYDVVQVNQPHAYLAARDHRLHARVGIFVNRSHGWEPNVWEAFARHGAPAFERRALLRRWASAGLRRLLLRHNRAVVRYADGLVVCSVDDRDYVVEREGAEPARVLALAPGVDPGFLEQPARAMTPERLTRVLYVGQFTPVKAPEIVARVMARLLAADERLAATWVCARQHHDDVRRLFPPEAIARLRLLDWMPRPQLAPLLDDHGLLLLPSHFEGFPLILLEAFARGLCVVATQVGGMRQAVRDGDNGMLSPRGDVARLAEAARTLMRRPDTAAALAAAARRTAEAHTWDRAARELEAFYASLQARRGSAGGQI